VVFPTIPGLQRIIPLRSMLRSARDTRAAAELGEVLPMFKASALNVAVGAVTNKKGARA
jgi:hypothetical protein